MAAGRTPQLTSKLAPWNRFEQDALDSTVRRRVFCAGRTQVVLCELGHHPEFPAVHVHPVDQVTTVLTGSVEALIDGKRFRVSAGRCLHVAAGTPHALRAWDPQGAETLNVFPAGEPSPPTDPAPLVSLR